VPRDLPELRFESSASYVLAGGLGGLGRNIVLWMVERGARNLILLSRRGSDDPSSNSFCETLQALDVTVLTPRCDISNYDSVINAISACEAMPPIRGCIQGAMILKVGGLQLLVPTFSDTLLTHFRTRDLGT
jgi:NAD(P)-dependent dehydrogenase (short-subunit alcohol dehydrogenase family)